MKRVPLGNPYSMDRFFRCSPSTLKYSQRKWLVLTSGFNDSEKRTLSSRQSVTYLPECTMHQVVDQIGLKKT